MKRRAISLVSMLLIAVLIFGTCVFATKGGNDKINEINICSSIELTNTNPVFFPIILRLMGEEDGAGGSG